MGVFYVSLTFKSFGIGLLKHKTIISGLTQKCAGESKNKLFELSSVHNEALTLKSFKIGLVQVK